MPIAFRDIGRIGYEPALALQRQLHAEVLAGQRDPVVLLLEHDPVITFGRRPGAKANLLAGDEKLAAMGVATCPTDRGGDITYHGPGQLVAYPILPLNDLGLNLRRYVELLEQAIIDTVAAFGVNAHRDTCAVGVWVGGTPSDRNVPACEDRRNGRGKRRSTSVANPLDETRAGTAHEGEGTSVPIGTTSGGAKLAAIGVRVQRWVSMHGLALNVDPRMEHFGLIVPCGLAGRPVTSLRQLLGDGCPTMDQVKRALREQLTEQLEAASPNEPRP